MKPPRKSAPKTATRGTLKAFKVSEDDSLLFQQAIGPVRPLNSELADDERPRPAPRPLHSQRDEREVINELLVPPSSAIELETGDELTHRKEGVSLKILKRLRRGYYSVGDELDLHRLTADAAADCIRKFLAECRAEGIQCVRIIHGKGLRSSDGTPVLKRLTEQLLRQRGDILAFASAPPSQGGTGAVIVLMAK